MQQQWRHRPLRLELDGGEVDGGLGVLQIQALHEVDDDGGDGDVAVPLAVGGDDEPGGVFAAGGGEDVVVGVDVAGPELALVDVGFGAGFLVTMMLLFALGFSGRSRRAWNRSACSSFDMCR